MEIRKKSCPTIIANTFVSALKKKYARKNVELEIIVLIQENSFTLLFILQSSRISAVLTLRLTAVSQLHVRKMYARGIFFITSFFSQPFVFLLLVLVFHGKQFSLSKISISVCVAISFKYYMTPEDGL